MKFQPFPRHQESKETKDGTEGALGFQEDTTADPSKATEAVEKPAEPAAQPVKPIYLAGEGWPARDPKIGA